MPYARKDLLTWQKGMYYHIYNRGVNRSTLFREPKNYLFTISKIKEYSLANHLAMIAYCLEPNHYHFLVRQDGDEPAGRSLKDAFGQNLFKPVRICCICADTFMEIPPKTGWLLTPLIGNTQIILIGSGNATGRS